MSTTKSEIDFTVPSWFRKYNFFTLLYTVAVILWGAYVRASGSGAGCGAHWPLCNGEVIPRPERIQTWVEFLHRSSSGVNLILVVFGYLFARKVAAPGSLVRRVALYAVIAIFLEALLGAGLVLLKLVEFDQSMARAVSIALHLVNTLFLISSLTALQFYGKSKSYFYSGSSRRVFPREKAFVVTLVLFVMLGVAGAITALGDTLFPATTLLEGMRADLAVGAHFLLRLRVIHPILALVWIFMVFFWSGKLLERGLNSVRAALLLAVILQFSLGIVNWVLMAPNFLQVIHLLVADLVYISFLWSGLSYEARESSLTT